MGVRDHPSWPEPRQPLVQRFGFTIHFSSDHAALVRLDGELDLSSTTEFAGVFDALDQLEISAIDVDCSSVSFIDCSCLNVMLRAARRAGDRGGRLVVSQPGQAVLRIIELTGTAGQLLSEPDAADLTDYGALEDRWRAQDV